MINRRFTKGRMNEFNITEIQDFQNRSLVEIIFRQLEGMILSGKALLLR